MSDDNIKYSVVVCVLEDRYSISNRFYIKLLISPHIINLILSDFASSKKTELMRNSVVFFCPLVVRIHSSNSKFIIVLRMKDRPDNFYSTWS